MMVSLRILLDLLEAGFSVPDIHFYLLWICFLGMVMEL